MSSEIAAAPGAGESASRHDIGATRHTLRMAGSIALPFVVGEALEWTLPFIASIFALQLLAVRRPPPTLVAGLASIAGLCIAFLVALVLTGLVLPYPTIFVLVIGLTMFGGLYAQARTAS